MLQPERDSRDEVRGGQYIPGYRLIFKRRVIRRIAGANSRENEAIKHGFSALRIDHEMCLRRYCHNLERTSDRFLGEAACFPLFSTHWPTFRPRPRFLKDHDADNYLNSIFADCSTCLWRTSSAIPNLLL